MSMGSAAYSGALSMRSSTAMSLLVKGRELFRKGPFLRRPVRGRFFRMQSFLRLTDQQIYLSLQKKQLLLHLFEQGNGVRIGFGWYWGQCNARLFVHLAWAPFIKLWDRIMEARILSVSNSVRIAA
jgi:hypothetical protein